MKIIMINDCAYVGKTLIKYLPETFNVLHLTRSRCFFDKTFGVARRIFSTKGDLYHIHYLLQDCFLALRFGKHHLIGHAHGSDLRDTLHSKKWGWIVKYNLKNCDKILVAQPTILKIAKEFNDTVEYFPIPYDSDLFYPKPVNPEREVKQILLVSPHNFRVKGTDKFLYALARVKIPFKVKTISYGRDAAQVNVLAKKLGLKVEFIPRVPHCKMSELYWDADLVLGSFGIGQLDTVAIEAMACGRPVIHSIKKEYFPHCPLRSYRNIDEVIEDIEMLLERKNAMKKIKQQYYYVRRVHSAKVLVKRLMNLYLVLKSN